MKRRRGPASNGAPSTKQQINWEEDQDQFTSAAVRVPSTGTDQADNEVEQGLQIARDLIGAGIPVFVAPPTTVNELGFLLPTKWEQTRPNKYHIDHWRPGDALGAVGGHVCDFLDIDPRNGGHVTIRENNKPIMPGAVPWLPYSYGKASTPSGGTHDMIAPLGVGKPKKEGVDLQGGKPDGSSRGFVFIAPTVRPSKVTGEMLPYRWEVEPDLRQLLTLGPSDDGGRHFAEWITRREAGTDFATWREGHGRPSQGQLEGILRKVAGAINGERNSLLYWGACRLTESSYPKEAFNALYMAGTHTGLSDREVVKNIRSANHALGGAL